MYKLYSKKYYWFDFKDDIINLLFLIQNYLFNMFAK